MATAATISLSAIDQHLKSPKADASDEFVAGAIKELDNDDGQFAQNIAQVGTWAIQIDEAFDKVDKTFKALIADFGKEFPQLSTFSGEWNKYKERWLALLWRSRDVAAEHTASLKRFDKIFIEMIASIQTDQDRLDVIAELGEFAKENHDAGDLSQGFLNLKRDVEDFVVRVDAWIATTSAELAERAKELQAEIEALKKEIQSLDKQLQEATAALLTSAAGAATMVGVLGLAVAGTQVAILFAQRIIKGKELSDRQQELKQVNLKQQGLAKIKSEFDGLRPDIVLICEKLVLFSQIWSSVQSQTLHFQATLKSGMDAVSNTRFQMELRLARDLSKPLIVGLEKYGTELTKKS